jgi:hypothetical protein
MAAKLEHAIELLAEDDSGTVDLGALRRAKDGAQRGKYAAQRNVASALAFD